MCFEPAMYDIQTEVFTRPMWSTLKSNSNTAQYVALLDKNLKMGN